jgi:hypothetical protein
MRGCRENERMSRGCRDNVERMRGGRKDERTRGRQEKDRMGAEVSSVQRSLDFVGRDLLCYKEDGCRRQMSRKAFIDREVGE